MRSAKIQSSVSLFCRIFDVLGAACGIHLSGVTFASTNFNFPLFLLHSKFHLHHFAECHELNSFTTCTYKGGFIVIFRG